VCCSVLQCVAVHRLLFAPVQIQSSPVVQCMAVSTGLLLAMLAINVYVWHVSMYVYVCKEMLLTANR